MGADPSTGLAVGLRGDRLEREQARLLYERHAGAIFGHCLQQLRDRSDAEDATQLTFLNALRGLQGGVVPRLELPWLFAIANRVISNRRRSDSRRRRVETPRDLAELDDRHALPVVETDELVHLDEGLAALPELQRRALLLREWQGLSYREIRHELELSQGAVEQLIFRARRSLARELTEPSKRRRFGGTISVVSLLPRLKAFLFDDPDGVVSLAKIALSTGTLVGAAAVATGAVHAPADDHHRNVVVPPRNTVPVVVRARPAAAVTADGLRHVRLDSRRGGWVARAAPEISAAHVPVGETPTSTALAPSVTAPQASSPKAEPAFAPPGTDADAPANARDIAPRTANGSTNAQGSPTPARHTVPPATDAKAGVRPAGSPAGSARREHATPPSATPATAPAKQSPNGGASGSPDVPSDNGGAPVADGQAAEANAASAQAVADTGASASAGDPASPRQSAGPPPSNAVPRPLDPERPFNS